MEEFLQNGFSGWAVSILTLILGGGFVVWKVTKRKTRQSNIKAGGDVAGGDIIKDDRQVPNEDVSSKEVCDTEQKDIEAGGDVAGGNIVKGEK